MKKTFLVEPTPKARARTVVHHGRVMSFTPKSTRDAEAAIRAELVGCGEFYNAGTPLVVRMLFVLTKPVSASRKVRYPAKRPDLDNYTKSVLDACNGFLWADDSQVCLLEASKQYGSPPRIELEVKAMGMPPFQVVDTYRSKEVDR